MKSASSAYSRLLTFTCWLTLAVNLVVWLLIRQADDLSLPTLLSYGPRWVWLVPPLVLVPFVLRSWKRLLPALLAILVAAVPILQLQVNVARADPTDGGTITVLTMNAGQELSQQTFRDLVAQHRPDVVALQEWGDANDAPPSVPGYTVACEDDLCVVTRFTNRQAGVLDRSIIGGQHAMATKTVIESPIGVFTLANVHLETVREGIEAIQHREPDALREMQGNITFRGLESRVVSRWIAESDGPLIIAGDFNLPTDSAIYRAHWSRWSNAFETAGWGYGWTKFTRWWGIRIDHVLFDRTAWEAIETYVGGDIGSDHRPVVARLRRR